MFFTVLHNTQRIPIGAKNQAFLFVDGWDDWRKFRTMFSLHLADENGTTHHIGSVKIGQEGLKPSGKELEPNHRAPNLPKNFNQLEQNFFSLGQGEDYYASLNKLSPELRQKIFIGLRDCVDDLNIFARFRHEEVMSESLLRSISETTVRGRLNRLAQGDAQLTNFAFQYRLKSSTNSDDFPMTFNVIPNSQPPTNVHVLIGRNGVGKTRFMRHLVLSILKHEVEDNLDIGVFEMADTGIVGSQVDPFAGLVLVSFSAFDDFELPKQKSGNIFCHQVGLWNDEQANTKSFKELGKEFADSLERCKSDVRAERWRTAIKALEEDDLFAEADVTSLMTPDLNDSMEDRAQKLFKRLSSGHAIVLLTITRLVELVDERTLVLLDEPEGHLHPPLLASFVRVLSDLLVRRNGVAIIATHSPVVLQEIPRSCVWKLRRTGASSFVERPTIETFGENIGMLTREVFGLQVTQSGFHHLLRKAILNGSDYETALIKFNNQLGNEGKSIIRALIAVRDMDSV